MIFFLATSALRFQSGAKTRDKTSFHFQEICGTTIEEGISAAGKLTLHGLSARSSEPPKFSEIE
jgi:hypothetical protein